MPDGYFWIVTLTPIFFSDAWIDTAAATSFGRSPRADMLIAKPLGLPHLVSSALALLTSPALFAVGYWFAFAYPMTLGGSTVEAI